MEFFGGMVFGWFLVFIAYKVKESRDRKSAYDESGLGGGGGRTPREIDQK